MSEVLNEILNVQGLTVEYPGFTLGPCSFSMKRGEILATAGKRQDDAGPGAVPSAGGGSGCGG